MVVFNTTFLDREEVNEMNGLVGKPFPLLTKIKLGGVGSRRMIIHNVSENFKSLLNVVSDINYVNIELRPNGIIVRLTQQLNRFSWVIPYYKLSIFNADYFSIHSDGSYIQLVKSKNSSVSKKFLQNLMFLKATSNSSYEVK
ncbi:hypothetical protein [Tenacibaculum sp. SG-28]|uniref:hypothetical protein n=1 Tax=Tenacibaculum sp. SG-28 TaxID=754426 RepID=UPI000CF41CA1|nr:hypothetical protein [Tenacibaculum sp. SG-28]PQJ23286.1 hypothetical protein BSU00_03505 [Tenacibaculum sp. SG-28]